MCKQIRLKMLELPDVEIIEESLDEAQKWIDFMNERGISWANWSLCDKSESSAALVGGANVNDGISESELTESGKFVFNNF